MAKGIKALPALMKRGRLLEPNPIREAKATFIAASDTVRSWVCEQCNLEPDAWASNTRLWNTFHNYDSDGGKTLSRREFYNRLEQIGGITRVRRGVDGFKGIELKPGIGQKLPSDEER